MKVSKSQISNLIFLVVIAILIIPQTRKPIQVFLNKGFALISPNIEKKENQKTLRTYEWQLKDENGNIFNFESVKFPGEFNKLETHLSSPTPLKVSFPIATALLSHQIIDGRKTCWFLSTTTIPCI